MLRATVAVLLLLPLATAAEAQKRVALVIGNSAYLHTGRLANPKNDATDMAAAFRKFGFVVVEGFDLDKAAFDRKVHDFARSLAGADAGVLFYAGHGLQVAGRNYLVPIDAKAELEALLHLEMVRADDIQRVMEASSKTNVLFLDACRDNPLARNLARSMGTRSSVIGTGLASIEAGYGTLISFSTHPGAVASDGAGRNSPYTAALVKYAGVAGDDLNTILINVRRDVRRDTQGKQVPWEHSSLEGRFYFAAPSAPAVAPPTPAYSAAADTARVCREVEGMSSLSMLGVLANQHKGTPAGDCIAARIDELKRQQVAAAPPPPAAKPAPPPTQTKPAVQVAPTPAPTLAPGTVFRDCPDCPEMVVVQAGSFLMGSPENEEGRSENEGPQRKVTIARPFAVGKHEVTYTEWDACVSDGGCTEKSDDFGWGRGRRPVWASWYAITQQFLPWFSRKASKTYRLLSEAEWEYAARAGTTTRYHFGNDEKDLCTYGNVADLVRKEHNKSIANCSDGYALSSPVGSFRPNAFGLYDMIGNNWEWVQDCWNANYNGAPADGSAWIMGDCSKRVARGGAWVSDTWELRSAHRVYESPKRAGLAGFRLARALD